jgi:glycosyltransferase involved in cell wall biosynthesis
MRILFVSNTPFLPPSAGNRARIDQMMGYLGAVGHEVAMLMLPAPDRPEWDVPGMEARVVWLEIAEDPAPGTRSRHLVSRAWRRARRIIRGDGTAVDIDAWCPRWFRAAVRARVAAWKPDVVVVEYVFLSACLDGLRAVHPCVTVIDTLDLMHARRAVYEAAGIAPQWFYTTYAGECRGLGRADLVLAIQEREAAVLRDMVPATRVVTVPHASPVHPAPVIAAHPRRLLLVASYNDLNVRGLAWLCEEVWPLVLAAVPDVELVVCGTIAQKLGTLPAGVRVRGYVSALADEYAAARVVVSPVPAGTGLLIKVVDGLCHGRPVVSTTAGAVGLDASEANGLLVADDPAGFAEALRALLTDDARWGRSATAAAAYAQRCFAPETVFAPLLRRLEAMCGATVGRAEPPGDVRVRPGSHRGSGGM